MCCKNKQRALCHNTLNNSSFIKSAGLAHKTLLLKSRILKRSPEDKLHTPLQPWRILVIQISVRLVSCWLLSVHLIPVFHWLQVCPGTETFALPPSFLFFSYLINTLYVCLWNQSIQVHALAINWNSSASDNSKKGPIIAEKPTLCLVSDKPTITSCRILSRFVFLKWK